jgi:hypothetical protein
LSSKGESEKKIKHRRWAWWLTLVASNLATQEVESRRIMVQEQPRQKVQETPSSPSSPSQPMTGCCDHPSYMGKHHIAPTTRGLWSLPAWGIKRGPISKNNEHKKG